MAKSAYVLPLVQKNMKVVSLQFLGVQFSGFNGSNRGLICWKNIICFGDIFCGVPL